MYRLSLDRLPHPRHTVTRIIVIDLGAVEILTKLKKLLISYRHHSPENNPLLQGNTYFEITRMMRCCVDISTMYKRKFQL